MSLWLRSFARFAPLLFAVLLGVELLKGRGLETGLTNAAVWGAISAAIVASTIVYKRRKASDCALCVDEPEEERAATTV